MQKIYILAALAGLGIGGFLAYNYQITPDTVFGVLGQAGKVAQDLFGQVAAWWSGIPEIGRGLILAGIPTAFTLFFAWTKSRAIQKVQETERVAQQRIGQMTERNFDLETRLRSATDLTNENSVLKAQIESLQNSDLTGNFNEAQQIISSKNAEIQQLITERNALSTIASNKYIIGENGQPMTVEELLRVLRQVK